MWPSGLEHSPIHQKAGVSIPGQGRYLSFRFDPVLVRVYTEGNHLLFLAHTGVSLSLANQ